MFVFVEGGDRLPHSSAVHHLQYFVFSILLVNKVQKVKHTELQKNSRVPFTNIYFKWVLACANSNSTHRTQ